MDLIMAKIPLWERVEIILATSEHTFVELQTCLEVFQIIPVNFSTNKASHPVSFSVNPLPISE